MEQEPKFSIGQLVCAKINPNDKFIIMYVNNTNNQYEICSYPYTLEKSCTIGSATLMSGDRCLIDFSSVHEYLTLDKESSKWQEVYVECPRCGRMAHALNFNAHESQWGNITSTLAKDGEAIRLYWCEDCKIITGLENKRISG